MYVNTAQEFDGSDAGARPDEAVSWGKIKVGGDSVKVSGIFLCDWVGDGVGRWCGLMIEAWTGDDGGMDWQ